MVFARHKVHQYKFKHQYKDQYLARVKANSPIKNYRRLVTNVNAGSKQKVLVISGTTGVGKSSIVEDVCKYIDGELINADSVQVYKGLDIGSNKRRPNPPLTIHLLDIASPKENFNAFEYKRRATEVIEDVLTRGKVPIVVGGTGFYLQSLIYGSPDAPKASKDVGAIHDRVMKQGWDESILELQKVDPTFAQKLRKNDFYRLVRGLDVFYSSGVPYSSFASSEVQIEENVEYDFRCIALTSNRLALYKEINIRCEKMIVNGLLQVRL
jgi:tRNA dimethylallyltransferase